MTRKDMPSINFYFFFSPRHKGAGLQILDFMSVEVKLLIPPSDLSIH